jgi:HEAT repeat protein
MTDYTPPEAAHVFAEVVNRHQAEAELQRQRLKDAPIGRLKQILRDPREPFAARAEALARLLGPRDPELPDILLGLFDDPDQRLWLMAIRSYCPPDHRVIARLRGMLDDRRGRRWSEAASALARTQDGTLMPRLLGWLDQGDEPHRNVAIECLTQLKSPEAHRDLLEAWEQGGRGEGDRVVLAVPRSGKATRVASRSSKPWPAGRTAPGRSSPRPGSGCTTRPSGWV